MEKNRIWNKLLVPQWIFPFLITKQRMSSLLPMSMGCPGGSSGKEPASQYRRHKSRGFSPWVRKIPWRRAWQPTPVFLPGEFHGQRGLVGYSPWGRKESDMTEATEHKCRYSQGRGRLWAGSSLKVISCVLIKMLVPILSALWSL